MLKNSPSDSKAIFDMSSGNAEEFITIEPSFKIGDEEIELETLKINLD